ncbi:MAG TPA: cytochrome B [Verrucomicrobia bacterium]|nr:cytochrome B [Verrucomicrobiota bacterium]HOP97946.1 cytochrome c3 family protein [Verrucomicrobiota bacterium]HPU55020.1 cytochrome c3 family protein [Verrucomicrobiota bacterium]
MKRDFIPLALAWMLPFFTASSLAAPTLIPDNTCLDCHSEPSLSKTDAAGREISLFVDKARLAASVHATNSCISCHSDITMAHPDDGKAAQRVDCAACHQRQTDSYGASVHGVALKAGDPTAPTCTDCHGTHDVLPHTDPASPLHFSKQAATCGACHNAEAADVEASVHGKAAARGVREAPTCTDCHSEHEIRTLKTESGLHISQEICSNCHASERLNTKFNLPSDRVKTFFDSYHGLAAQYGSTLAANCGSCHGYHKILPSSDPESTIHPSRLVQTCGQCHPGASEKFAAGKVHVDLQAGQAGSDISTQAIWWVRRIYLVLIFGVIGVMVLHNGLLFWRKMVAHLRAGERTVLRMDRSQRWQHAVLAISFVVLAVTGFALKWPDSWLARLMGSSEPLRRWTHRIAGVVLLLVGLYHVVYVIASRDGRRLFRDLFPSKKDLADIRGAARYLLGLSRERPKMGRFGYTEKMEYWAVAWGTIIMGVTGLMIWFKMGVTQFLPRWIVDVALAIHYYEAILACLAILVWHFYHVIFDPDVYPLNPACWDGKVSEHWHKEEHPLDSASQETMKEPAIEPAQADRS